MTGSFMRSRETIEDSKAGGAVAVIARQGASDGSWARVASPMCPHAGRKAALSPIVIPQRWTRWLSSTISRWILAVNLRFWSKLKKRVGWPRMGFDCSGEVNIMLYAPFSMSYKLRFSSSVKFSQYMLILKSGLNVPSILGGHGASRCWLRLHASLHSALFLQPNFVSATLLSEI